MRFLKPSYWAGRVLLLVSKRRDVANVPVYFAPELRAEIPTLVSRLGAAIDLLARTPVRPRSAIGKYIRRVMVGPLPHIQGEWDDALRQCTLDSGFLGHPDTRPADIASTILHEAQHARLSRLGVRYNAQNRIRMERLCIQAQLDFAHQLQDQRLIEQLTSNHERAEQVWDLARLTQLRLSTVERWVKEFELPSWAERVALAVIRGRAA